MSILATDLATLRGIDAHKAHLTEVETRLREIDTEAAGQPLDTERQAEWESLDERRNVVKATLTQLEARARYIEEMAQSERNVERAPAFTAPNVSRTRLPEDVFDISAYRGRTSSHEGDLALMRDGAKKVVEMSTIAHEDADEARAKGHVFRLLQRVDHPDVLARRLIATGSPAYQRAFGKILAGYQLASLTGEEQRALAVIGASQLGDGGYAVPFQLDPTIIPTSNGSVNPLPTIANVVNVTGNTWKGVTSAGITASYVGEESAVTDNTPTLAQPESTLRTAKVLIKFSIEADGDWPQLQAEMARVLQDAKDDLEADKFVTGAGPTTEPEGIIAGLDPTSYVATIDQSGAVDLAVGDVYALEEALPARFRARARFLANKAIYNKIAQFSVGSVGEGAVWRRGIAVGQPPELIGYPAHEATSMASTTTAENLVLLIGDFSYFTIIQKLGLSIEVIQHMVNGDGNPTGQRGLFAYWRNSSVITSDNAFRVLHAGAIAS